MFFLKRKKPETKNNLPEKLKALRDVDYPAWVWDPEFRMIIWSNTKGMSFWNVQTRNELKELIFPETHAMVMSFQDNAKPIRSGKIIYDDIALITRPQLIEFRCKLEAQKLPDGRDGILLIVTPQEQQEAAITGQQALSSEKNKSESLFAGNATKDRTETNEYIAYKDNTQSSLEGKSQKLSAQNTEKTLSEKQRPISFEKYLNKAATFSCNINGIIVGADDIAIDFLATRTGDRFISLFSDKQVGQNILSMALKHQRYSTIIKTDIAHRGVLPYVIQTSQFMHHNQLHFNTGFMLITENAYEMHTESNNKSAEKNVPVSHQEASDIEYTDEFLSAAVIGNLASSDRAIFDVGYDGIIKLHNQMASYLTGYDEHALIGQNVIYLFGNEAQPVLTELVFNATQEILDDLHDGVACRFSDANGVERDCKLIVRTNKSKTGYWFILKDNSQQHENQSKSQNNNLHQQANHMSNHNDIGAVNQLPIVSNSVSDKNTALSTSFSDNAIPSLVSAVSHEIRAPLNAISGYAEMIESEMFGALPDARYKDFAKSIRGAGQYALSIVNELLDYSKLKAGGFVPKFEATDIFSAVSDAVATVYPMAQARNIEISQTILTGTPKISSDPRLLRQILINLLTNAVKYSHDNDQVLITAGATKTGRIMFEVTDFGRGMTEQEIHDALVPFQRGHQANDIPGTGLGLSLSKELAELTHGRFMIDSVPGQKTRVRIIYEVTSIVE